MWKCLCGIIRKNEGSAWTNIVSHIDSTHSYEIKAVESKCIEEDAGTEPSVLMF